MLPCDLSLRALKGYSRQANSIGTLKIIVSPGCVQCAICGVAGTSVWVF